MRWFMDTEFNEDGRIIDLISIALVSEDGRHYYAVSRDFDPADCNDWVKANVLPKLPPDRDRWMSRTSIAIGIRDLLLTDGEKPEIWGYYSDYDWVVFCQLYGRMIDLPRGFPMYCMDLKQLMKMRGIEKSSLPRQDDAGAHDALADARWIAEAHRFITDDREHFKRVLPRLMRLLARANQPPSHPADRDRNEERRNRAWTKKR